MTQTKLQKQLREMSDEHEAAMLQLNNFEQVIYSVDKVLSKQHKETIEQFFEFMEVGLFRHFSEEESHFFPLLRNLSQGFIDAQLAQNMVHQLEEEHALIKSMYSKAKKQYTQLNKSKLALDWFIASSMSLVDFIRIHSRKENSIVHLLTEGLSEEGTKQEIYDAYANLHTMSKEYV